MTTTITFSGSTLCVNCGLTEATVSNGEKTTQYCYFSIPAHLLILAAAPAPTIKEGICERCRPLEKMRGTEY